MSTPVSSPLDCDASSGLPSVTSGVFFQEVSCNSGAIGQLPPVLGIGSIKSGSSTGGR